MGKAIIGMLKDSPKVRVVKAVDTVPAAGEWARSQGIEFTTDYAAVLADANVYGVILCTPHTMHSGAGGRRSQGEKARLLRETAGADATRRADRGRGL